MVRGRLREQRAMIVAHAYISSPREDDTLDIKRFIEHGDLGEPAPVILPYNPEVLQQIQESGKFGA